MSNFYYGAQQHAGHTNMHASQHPHHAGRSRRSTRTTGYHHRNEQKQIRALQLKKEAAIETAMEQNFRREFEAARSFDIEDDEMFCPFHLLTEDDVSNALVSNFGQSFEESLLQNSSHRQCSCNPSTPRVQTDRRYRAAPPSILRCSTRYNLRRTSSSRHRRATSTQGPTTITRRQSRSKRRSMRP